MTYSALLHYLHSRLPRPELLVNVLDQPGHRGAALDAIMQAICPPFTRLTLEFWATEAGQELSRVCWAAYRDEALTLSDAALRLHPELPRHVALMRLKRVLDHGGVQVYYRPVESFGSPRRGRTTIAGALRAKGVAYLRMGDLEKLRARTA